MHTTSTQDNSVTLATTILDQMGGTRRLGMMIGAKNFVAIPNGVIFRFAAKAKNKSNAFRVTLLPSDTYKIEFVWFYGSNVTVRKEMTDMYAEDLRRIFESETGLYLSL